MALTHPPTGSNLQVASHPCWFHSFPCRQGDVRCKGHFAECLASTAAQPQDVLCTWSWSQQQQPEWDKWDRLAGRLNKVPAAQRRSCFAPLLRLSRRAMRKISQEMGRSAGYMEVRGRAAAWLWAGSNGGVTLPVW